LTKPAENCIQFFTFSLYNLIFHSVLLTWTHPGVYQVVYLVKKIIQF